MGSNEPQEAHEPLEPQPPFVFPIVPPSEAEDAALGIDIDIDMDVNIMGSPLHPPPPDTATATSMGSLPPQSFASFHTQDFFEVQSSGPVASTASAAAAATTTSASLSHRMCPYLNDKEGYKWDLEDTKNNEDGSTTYFLRCHHKLCYATKRVTVTAITTAHNHQEEENPENPLQLQSDGVCPVHAQNQNWVLLGDLKNDTNKKSATLIIDPKKDAAAADNMQKEVDNYILQCPRLFCQARKTLRFSVHDVYAPHSNDH